MNNRRSAVQILHKMIGRLGIFTYNPTKVGEVTQRLSKEEREVLNHLKSDDIQNWRHWSK
jgi:hypothetical protein